MEEVGKHILVTRFSALGDVAMTVPVLKQLLEQHPALQLTMVAPEKFRVFFDQFPRLRFFAADLKGRHSGFPGLLRLFRELKEFGPFDGYADLHNVLRTSILRVFARLAGIKVAVIDKGRSEKKELTRKRNKRLRPLKSTFERYSEVFEQLGCSMNLDRNKPLNLHWPLTGQVQNLFQTDLNSKLTVGIAPFAQYKEKTYPPEKMEEVVRELSARGIRICLFGGGEREVQILKNWENKYENAICIAGRLTIENELALMSELKLMVCMDSANMHLASLAGTRAISIWGATHPFAGFYGWNQKEGDIVQVSLYCRPCSVFGNKPCYRGDHACMNTIEPRKLVEKILRKLNIQDN
ncbi:MAG TPA: glycosyltransferase family 9 protein [Parasegetibacter sp.]